MPESLGFPNLASLLVVTAVFTLAGLVKGVVGLGLPTISMALLASLMSPAEASALLILPSLVTNVWQIRPWRALWPMFKRIGTMQLGVCVGTLVGAWRWGAPSGAWAVVSLGGALIGYAAWGLSGKQMSVRPSTERWLGPVVGTVTGLMTAATGVFVIPAVPYLQALGLRRDDSIRAMGISFTVSTLALAVGLCLDARYPIAALGTSALMLPPALAGMAMGQHLRRWLAPALFRRCFFGSLILLGMHMIVNELRAH